MLVSIYNVRVYVCQRLRGDSDAHEKALLRRTKDSITLNESCHFSTELNSKNIFVS